MTAAPTAYRESVRMLPCEGERLLAVLAEPDGPATTDLGVVIVVGGPQYRAGSHRQFVQLARALASAGICTLRFDVRGMGDSTGAQRSFEQIGPDTGAAINALLAARPGLHRVALWGLCDGASAALLYLHESADPRVAALCLLNPWVRSEVSLARTHVKHYYARRLRDRSFWIKLLSGRIAGAALRGLLNSFRLARASRGANADMQEQFQARMCAAWHGFDGQLLLMLSGNDYTAREFLEYIQAEPSWANVIRRPNVDRLDLANADHTLSERRHQLMAEVHAVQWLQTVR